ncbi:hypothetical protein Daus18300_007601 [Diaporthe australafricana]|uniref:DUF7708 domain-containing protein n=1 Tax=Diaporthe australafricana TaxID=127596 RepID=A0ABR3WMH0_9PEZI
MAFLSESLTTDAAQEWYIPAPGNGTSVLETAFKEASQQFVQQSGQNEQANHIIKLHNSLEDVQNSVKKCIADYEAIKPDSKALKWLRQLSEKVIFYEGVVDVIIQQHPESVSLIWGGMKFFFLGVINHEKTVKGLAKALSEIGDALPRVKIRADMFPTNKMEIATSRLCADILKFLTRAHKWYCEGRLKRAFHSFTQPFDLRYADILEDIRRNSSVVQDLAACGQMVELRHVNKKIDKTLSTVTENFSRVYSNFDTVLVGMNDINARVVATEAMVARRLDEISITTHLISSTTMDTNKQLSDLQFSQIMQSIADPSLWDPQKTLNYLRVNQKRSSQNQARLLAEGFWDFARMRRWSTARNSDISIVKGDFRSRQALRCFSVDVIEQLRLEHIPVLFALGTSLEGAAAKSMSNTDLLKYLVRQILDLRRCGQTEKSMSLNAAAFSGNLSEREWFSLLEKLLLGLSGSLFIVVDLELLNREISSAGGFHWLSGFLNLFTALSERGAQLTIKVMLVSYSSELPFETSRDEYSGFVIPAKKMTLTARRRKGKGHAKSRGRQSRFGG